MTVAAAVFSEFPLMPVAMCVRLRADCMQVRMARREVADGARRRGELLEDQRRLRTVQRREQKARPFAARLLCA